VSTLGIIYPKSLIEVLGSNCQPTYIMDAQELARDLMGILPVVEKLAVFDGGGILSYLFLKKAGYAGEMKGVIKVLRDYPNGKPRCQLQEQPEFTPSLVIDDILASGQTLAMGIGGYCNRELEFACLMASSNVPKGKGGYRIRQGSSIPRVARMYCAQIVNGLIDQNKANRKPAILSLRYLLTKAVDNGDYAQTYLAKKFGGGDKAQELCSLLRSVDREPLNLLRRDYNEFLRTYGGK
ncbi:MAG: hypothetical protein AABY26_02965, partial [Nanoarchaeota archaeon]